jgi:hypothetical protein
MPCDQACQDKIIIDTRRNERVARFVADAAVAHLQAFERGLSNGSIPEEMQDRLHAFSELNCHRAALMLEWAEEIHRETVAMAGGEYSGTLEVDGVKGIRKKE